MDIRLLETDIEREQVYRLVHDAYVDERYLEKRPDGKFIHYGGVLDRIPETDIFLAYNIEGELIGTNSLTRDSDAGLHTMWDFPAQTYRERMTGKRLASSWRIATRSDARSNAGTVGALIRATVRRAIALGIETTLFTFNPKHFCRYRIALNMDLIGFSDSTLVNVDPPLRLHAAPAILMRVYTSDVPPRWFLER